MKIVPGTRKHASATAGASWNCCESSRCLKLDYMLPLTLALPLVRRPDLLEKVSNSGFGRAGQSAANSRLSCVTARPRLTPPPALGTGSGFGGKGGGVEGGEGCILPLKGRLPLLADASRKCFWCTPPASIDEQYYLKYTDGSVQFALNLIF